jgi:hypothetical protein
LCDERLHGICADLAFFDEAHRTSSQIAVEVSQGERTAYETDDKLEAKLSWVVNGFDFVAGFFLTATPTQLMRKHEPLWGTPVYEMSWREAIAEGYIAPFKIVVGVLRPRGYEKCRQLMADPGFGQQVAFWGDEFFGQLASVVVLLRELETDAKLTLCVPAGAKMASPFPKR